MPKQSVIIANRHSTSISLEEDFFAELKTIAVEQNLSVNQLVTQIDSERSCDNLSSAIRIFILKYLKKQISI